jgi:hypothetical protein
VGASITVSGIRGWLVGVAGVVVSGAGGRELLGLESRLGVGEGATGPRCLMPAAGVSGKPPTRPRGVKLMAFRDGDDRSGYGEGDSGGARPSVCIYDP